MEGSVMHEFVSKVHLGAGGLECLFERCENGSELSCGHEVQVSPSLTGKAGINSFIALPTNKTILKQTNEPVQEVTMNIFCPEDGYYACCLDNRADKFNSKLVHFQIVVLHHKEVKYFHKANHNALQNESDINMYRLYDRVFQIATDVGFSTRYLHHSLNKIEGDWDTLRSNMSRVSFTSMLAVIVVCFVGFGQVYSVKRMFKNNALLIGGRGSNKP
uniref:Uncharacterized LOC100182863 n=1 Tax=Ciona intestinalis TaxID=7719 RepID=F6W2H8_CIOIN|nr:uncharacterized protein LOC100182863 [Ciona intestinalis]|eukprot:XP_002130024.1 uncharacterized protein LOC100182863 [Ciona intestinalis]